jgi:hypothetical protein
MRWTFLAFVAVAGCAEEPPCGERDERPAPTDGWCLEEYQPERICCEGDACSLQLAYSGETFLEEPSLLDKPCGDEAGCLDWFAEVYAWCAWEADDDSTRGAPPVFPEI